MKNLLLSLVLLNSTFALLSQNVNEDTILHNQFCDYVEWLKVHPVEINTISETNGLDKFVKEWIGIPYRYGGMSKRGIDCSGLTQKLYQEIYNIKLPRTAKQQWNFTKRIDFVDMQLGDLIFFKSKRSPSGWHVGFYLGNGYFVHAPKRGDRVKISNLNKSYYSKTFHSGGRLGEEQKELVNL